jgi:hypothetical protein
MKSRPVRGKINKGAPSGLVVSLAFHALAFFIAGLFVVFTVVNKAEPEFEPPPQIERPKMKLKKPKVKVRKSSNPKPSSRIVAKVKTKQMPEIQLPDLEGVGEGLLGGSGFGGGELLDLPDIEELSVFGATASIGSDFVGTFYDPKRLHSGNNSSMANKKEGGDEFVALLYKFLKRGMDESVLSKYYSSPKKLYTTTFAMPVNLSLMAPTAFGSPETVGCMWLVHYKGKLVYHEDIKFRFHAAADDLLSVMVDGEYVIQYNHNNRVPDTSYLDTIWYNSTVPYPIGLRFAVVGDWIELKAGVSKDMEVTIAETPGGNFQAILCVEVEGVDYPKNKRGGPILPLFKTSPVSLDLADAISSMSYADDFSMFGGPVFCDYKTSPESGYPDIPEGDGLEKQPDVDKKEVRIWKTVSGQTFEGYLLSTMIDSIFLETEKNGTVKVPVADLSEEDRRYLVFEDSPEFKLKFITGRDSIPPPEQAPFTWYRPIKLTDYQFGVELEQVDSKDYPHPLTVEYFAIADELHGDRYRLLDYGKEVFIPSEFRRNSFTFRGRKLRTQKQAILPWTPLRGYDYCGRLVVITDERGKVIQHWSSRKFLLPHLDELRKLKPGNYFDEDCRRTMPTGPSDDDRSNLGWRG